MPRRGEYNRDFPPPSEPAQKETPRIGLREVTAPDPRGVRRTCSVDPSEFLCEHLAMELADEWVELMTSKSYAVATAGAYREAITSFCKHVDATVARAREASLAASEPDLHLAVTEWLQVMPLGYRTGSRTPAWTAGRLRTLIARRIEHPDRHVAGLLGGWVSGALGLRRGQSEELDEFTLAEKKTMVRAAWADKLATDARIRRGWELAAHGHNPEPDGWTEPANLLWAISNSVWSCEEIAHRLPPFRTWPPALRDLIPDETYPNLARRVVLRALVRMLLPHNLDLQSYRILMMAATGRAPEEVVGLDEDDIEYGPKSVMIDFSKHRAHSEQRRAFGAEPSQGTLHPARPRLDAAELTHDLLRMARPLAALTGASPVPLFLRASVDVCSLRISPFSGDMAGASFATWLQAHSVTVKGSKDIRRLRKSGKVEKAIAFKGRISDIADDHSVETFRGHYAHGTTLRVIAGGVITAAQKRWFDQALTGPTLLTPEAEATLGRPEQPQPSVCRQRTSTSCGPAHWTWVFRTARTPSTHHMGVPASCVRSLRPGAWSAATRSSFHRICPSSCSSPPISNSSGCGWPRHTSTHFGARATRTSRRLCGPEPMPRSRRRANSSWTKVYPCTCPSQPRWSSTHDWPASAASAAIRLPRRRVHRPSRLHAGRRPAAAVRRHRLGHEPGPTASGEPSCGRMADLFLPSHGPLGAAGSRNLHDRVQPAPSGFADPRHPPRAKSRPGQ